MSMVAVVSERRERQTRVAMSLGDPLRLSALTRQPAADNPAQ